VKRLPEQLALYLGKGTSRKGFLGTLAKTSLAAAAGLAFGLKVADADVGPCGYCCGGSSLGTCYQDYGYCSCPANTIDPGTNHQLCFHNGTYTQRYGCYSVYDHQYLICWACIRGTGTAPVQ
jgi:hypothetical protein